MPTFSPDRLIAGFCDRLVAHDLPDLPPERRAATVAFTRRRVAGLPTPMAVGVTVVAVVVGGAGRVVGAERVADFLTRRPLPLAGEYLRLLRSLAYAYVWETWPATTSTGAVRR